MTTATATIEKFVFLGPPHQETGDRGRLPVEIDAKLVTDTTFNLDDYLRRVVEKLFHGLYGYPVSFDECETEEAPDYFAARAATSSNDGWGA